MLMNGRSSGRSKVDLAVTERADTPKVIIRTRFDVGGKQIAVLVLLLQPVLLELGLAFSHSGKELFE